MIFLAKMIKISIGTFENRKSKAVIFMWTSLDRCRGISTQTWDFSDIINVMYWVLVLQFQTLELPTFGIANPMLHFFCKLSR